VKLKKTEVVIRLGFHHASLSIDYADCSNLRIIYLQC